MTTKKGKTDCSPTKLFTFRHQDTISSQQRTLTTKKGKTGWIPITENSALLPLIFEALILSKMEAEQYKKGFKSDVRHEIMKMLRILGFGGRFGSL